MDRAPGFSLIEVVVALAVLSIALLGVARVLTSATRLTGAARRAELASELAATLGAVPSAP